MVRIAFLIDEFLFEEFPSSREQPFSLHATYDANESVMLRRLLYGDEISM